MKHPLCTSCDHHYKIGAHIYCDIPVRKSLVDGKEVHWLAEDQRIHGTCKATGLKFKPIEGQETQYVDDGKPVVEGSPF